MSVCVCVCFPLVKLRALTAEAILGGILLSCFMVKELSQNPEYDFLWKVLVVVGDNASSNRRCLAHLDNITEHKTTLIIKLACLIHRLHTATKPLLATINCDNLYRWAGVFRVNSYRLQHWAWINGYIKHRFVRVHHSIPDPRHSAMLRKLLYLTCVLAKPESVYVQNLVNEAIAFFKHDVRAVEVVHLCQGCCRSPEEALKKCIRIVYKLAFRCRMSMPKQNDWQAVWNTAAKVVLGYCLYHVFDLPFLMRDQQINLREIRQRSAEAHVSGDIEDSD